MNNFKETSDFDWGVLIVNLAIMLFFSWLICTINGMLDRVVVINEFIGLVAGTFFSIVCVPFFLTGVISIFKKQRFKPRAFFIYSSWIIVALEIIGSFSK